VAEHDENLLRWMPAVVDYRQRLASLQGAWDNLALLSHLGDDGTNLSSTREAFESLATRLVTHLGAETHRKTVLDCQARAQVAIDILVRNLFERTADIGHLAADDFLARFASEVPKLRSIIAQGGADADSARRTLAMATDSIQKRLSEYVAKYSVYHNVVLVSPDREVLVQLPGGQAPAQTRDPLIATTLASSAPYVECFRASDLVPDARRALIYAHRIGSDDTLGVLCLCFRLEDECEGIFQRLNRASGWSVLALLDDRDQVIASTDPYQLPAGARVPTAPGPNGGVIRFAGREYLAVTRTATPYQGYAGPSWRGHVMVPVERAFEPDPEAQGRCDPSVLADIRRNPANFAAGLREIPQQADAIQRDLNRSVWNGSVRLSTGSTANVSFAKALLREISNMGRRTKDVFERSIGELHETIVTSVLQDSEFLASLATELFSRNLYERSNDCRWWALNRTLCRALTGGDAADHRAAAAVLSRINSLYPVYHSLVLFDAERRVVAVSREDQAHLVGAQIDEPWAEETLGLLDSQGYCVSPHRPSLFCEQPTLIYSAAVRAKDRRVAGGVAVVFDAARQLESMLLECLPRDERGEPLAGALALFIDRQGKIMSSAGAIPASSSESLVRQIQDHLTREGSHAVRIGNEYYALGVRRDPGYREYPGIGARAAVLLPLGAVLERGADLRRPLPQCTGTRDHARHDLHEFTTFAAGGAWYALPTSCVLEAVDARALQTITTAGPPWAGVIMHGDEAIPVVDLATLLERPSAEPPSVVILLRLEGRSRAIGLLVEVLGDNPEVPRDRLMTISMLEQSAAALLVEQAIQPVNPLDGLVLVLNTKQLAATLFGTPAASGASGERAAADLQRQRVA